MYIKRVFACTLALGCLAGAGLAGQRPAQAGPPFLPFGEYEGFIHHNTKAGEENEPAELLLDNVSNGQFTGHFGPVAISGKFNTATHKITFSGSSSGPGGTIGIKDGKGQLSATALYCVGTMNVTGSDPEITGPYTFSIATPQEILPLGSTKSVFGEAPRAAGPTSLSNINNLLAGYSGRSHHNTLPADENQSFTFTVSTKKPNGNFTGFLGFVPITGHVDKKGKATFKGVVKQGADVLKVKNGVAQLSAQGNYLLGSFKATGTGNFAEEAGGYTFESAAVI
jgi:hypothetical protein